MEKAIEINPKRTEGKYFKYFPKTGNFRRKKTMCTKIKIGDLAGSKSHGYIVIMVNNKIYSAHRLAFLYMEGYFPEYCVDHIDRNPSNNK